ncbi:MAG: carboxypeptidase regulatory-like domain-containing protein, partial [Candidatus Electryoneaceae bacterium]|nr:carboxypeptidase regulatory-like domain-containing protein [Candidatus Electryoneaceae bacterium]
EHFDLSHPIVQAPTVPTSLIAVKPALFTEDHLIFNETQCQPVALNLDPFDWHAIYRRVQSLNPRRDELLGYNVYVDENEDPIERVEEPQWAHDIGTDDENNEHTYMIAAIFPDGEDEMELEGASTTGIANSAPRNVNDAVVTSDGLNYTVGWSRPTMNVDNSRCTDYAGCEIYIGDELIQFVEAEEDVDDYTWDGAMEDGEEGWYTFRLIARDEVPNRSEPIEVTTAIGVALINDFERDAFFDADPAFNGWTRTDEMGNGPDDAHSGQYAWATSPFRVYYANNADWTITTEGEFAVLGEASRLEFYHYMSAEDGHDGGQVLISVDGGEWELIEPDGGYPNDRVAGLINEPGYTGRTDGWELVGFDLSPYADHNVRFRLRFGTDEGINWFPGWYIDDVVMWNCQEVDHAQVSGSVVDQDENGIEGVTISVGDDRQTITDQNGNYQLTDLVPGETTIQASKIGYRGVIEEIVLEPGEDIQHNFALYHPEITTDPDRRFEEEVYQGQNLQFSVSIRNEGEEEVEYSLRLTETLVDEWPEADVGLGLSGRSAHRIDGGPRRDDPWDVWFIHDISEKTGYQRIQGVEFADDRFFLTAGDPVQGPTVLVLDYDGSFLNSFPQPLDNLIGWGLRDLAWDGELMYGSQDRNIYAFTLEGEVAGQQIGAPLTVNRALAFDPNEDGFWAAEWDSPWYLVDRDGEVQFRWDDHGLGGVYGFAYHPDEPDGRPLYVFNREDDGSTVIYRADPMEGNIEQVQEVEFDGTPTGCFITGEWDANIWVLGGIVNDQLIGYELGDRDPWVSVDPTNGVIDGESETDVRLSVRIPEDADVELVYSGKMSVIAYGETKVDVLVLLEILEGDRQSVALQQGWNLISTFIEPKNTSVEHILRSVFHRGNLMMVKDEIGRSWRPPDPMQPELVNTLADWDVFGGYWVNVSEAETINIFGERLSPEISIHLKTGWNWVSYLPDQPENPSVALASILDELQFVKDCNGGFIAPEFGYYGMDMMMPGQGYKLLVSRDVDLVYRNTGTADVRDLDPIIYSSAPTGSDMSLLITSSRGIDISGDGNILVLAGPDRRMVANVSSDRMTLGLTIPGDDSLTPQIDGARPGEALTFVYLPSGEYNQVLETTVIAGEMTYENDAFTVVELWRNMPAPNDFTVRPCYPNPFNGRTSVRFGLPAPTDVGLVVWDVQGRQVLTVSSKHFNAGWHTHEINASSWSSGIYFLELATDRERITRKLVLTR